MEPIADMRTLERLDELPNGGISKEWGDGGCRVVMCEIFSRKKLYRNVVSKQRMKPGQPTLPQSVYPSTLDESRSVERLVATMQALQNFSGALISSPLFGKLTHSEYVSLHIAHCAHHLSFLKTNLP